MGRDFYDGPDSRTFVHGSTHTWEPLTYLGKGLNAYPWNRSEDGRIWTFKLKDGVRFHDGTALTANNAKASILRIASQPRYDPTGVYRHLDHVDVKGRLFLFFHLKEPAPIFPISWPTIPAQSFIQRISGPMAGLTGTGPFFISKIRPGDRIELNRFDGYYGDKPSFSRVVFRTLPDAQARIMTPFAGDIDAVADVGTTLPQKVAMLKLLNRLKNETSLSLLFISHNHNTFRVLCDRLLVLEKG